MKTTIKIGIPPRTPALRIERQPWRSRKYDSITVSEKTMDALMHLRHYGFAVGMSDEPGAWLLWIHANTNFTQGTFLRMHDNGCMERVTVYEDGSERVAVIKPSDEETPQ